MTGKSPKEILKWISQDARLQELMDCYPEIWQNVGPKLVAAMEDGSEPKLRAYTDQAKSLEQIWHQRIRKSRQNAKIIESALPYLVESRMALLSLSQCYQAAAIGKASGKIRFNRINGFIIQKLFFRSHLTRKPASLRWFRFWWPLITQKRLLMPLVQKKGIYCFFSRELIEKLSSLIGNRSCLEIGAGDGTLSRFLMEAGTQIHATDDQSWKNAIEYPETVERLSARQALDKYQPQAVLCSWPPPGNAFEQRVFSTESVELYIMIGSRFQFAAGNWNSYETQKKFSWRTDPELSSLVLPPELESAVIIFQRTIESSSL
jgi:hypothetical protein